MISLKNKPMFSLEGFSRDEILCIIDLASELKNKKKGLPYDKKYRGKLLDGKNIVLIFDKPSTRTRCSFEVACHDEGAHVTCLTNSQMGRKESIEDTGRVLGRLYDGIAYRGYDIEVCRTLSQSSMIPVWNALTDSDHPTQVLADFMTAMEHTGKDIADIKYAYVGDGRNNVAKALLTGAHKMGMEMSVASPKSLWPEEPYTECAFFTEDPYEAVRGADVIYTDIWFSMGEDDVMKKRIELLKDYQVNMDLIRASGNDKVIFQHCLPSFHDLGTEIGSQVYEKTGLKEMEVTDEVFRSRHSVVFDEAENRMHTIKAVMVSSIGNIYE